MSYKNISVPRVIAANTVIYSGSICVALSQTNSKVFSSSMEYCHLVSVCVFLC